MTGHVSEPIDENKLTTKLPAYALLSPPLTRLESYRTSTLTAALNIALLDDENLAFRMIAVFVHSASFYSQRLVLSSYVNVAFVP